MGRGQGRDYGTGEMEWGESLITLTKSVLFV